MDIKALFCVTPRMFIATFAGAVLFTLMSRFIMLPTPIEGVFFFPSYALLGLFATVFGPVAGALISLSGMLVVGIMLNNIFVSYTIASVVCGFIYGLAKNHVRVDMGEFSGRDIIAYNFTQVIGNFIAWALLAPVLELVLNPGRLINEVFLQGIVASFVNILSAEFIGTPLLFLYSRIRGKQLKRRNKNAG
jgi:energy-coupling factor transport system substrate-specific component